MKKTASRALSTPVGNILLTASAEGLVSAEFCNKPESNGDRSGDPKAERHLTAAARAVSKYFRGDYEALSAVPVVMPEGTVFQKRVWKELGKIRPGTTVSYGDIAKRIGSPRAFRAVGGACHANPLCLFVPCHRIIGADRALTGYAGGLKRKVLLLAHEARG